MPKDTKEQKNGPKARNSMKDVLCPSDMNMHPANLATSKASAEERWRCTKCGQLHR